MNEFIPEENQFSDLSFWIQRNWHPWAFSNQAIFGIYYWLRQESNK